MYKQHYHEDREGLTGLKRFSNEQWIGSHPALQPCDLAGTNSKLFPTIESFRTGKKLLENQSASFAPRIPLREGLWFRFDKVVFEEKALPYSGINRPYEYFLLPGILYRFFKIYGIFPQRNSWIWSYYPRGKEWQAKIDTSFFPNGTVNEARIW